MTTIGNVVPYNKNYGDEVSAQIDYDDDGEGTVALNFTGVEVKKRQVCFGFGFRGVELDRLIELLTRAREEARREKEA